MPILVHQMRNCLHISSGTEPIIPCGNQGLPIKIINQETDRWYAILGEDFRRVQ